MNSGAGRDAAQRILELHRQRTARGEPDLTLYELAALLGISGAEVQAAFPSGEYWDVERSESVIGHIRKIVPQ